MTRATADGGNCELAVLASVDKSQMPDSGTTVAAARIEGRRTIAEMTPAPVVLLLGALLTAAGLKVTLSRRYQMDATIEISPEPMPCRYLGLWGIRPSYAPMRSTLFPVLCSR